MDGSLYQALESVPTSTEGDCAAWGDYDNDGDLDLFVATGDVNELANRNCLFRNDKPAGFTEVFAGSPVIDQARSVRCVWVDYDNNGFLDLHVVNSSTTATSLPALTKARTKAQGICCMNNTRNLALAWSMHADDHKGTLVENQNLGGGDVVESSWITGPASYHNGAAGFAFADGHSEIKRWLSPRTLVPVRYVDYTRTMFDASDDPRDIRWVQERSTERPN